MNPNIDMGFQKFAKAPNPDFIMQVFSDHNDETCDNQGNATNAFTHLESSKTTVNKDKAKRLKPNNKKRKSGINSN